MKVKETGLSQVLPTHITIKINRTDSCILQVHELVGF